MNRLFVISAVLLGGWCTCIAPAVGQSGWATERVQLRDGRRYQGLIESQDDARVHLIQIGRSGQTMHLVIRPIDKRLISKVVRLDPQRRAELRRRIEQFRNRASIEAGRMKDVDLTLVTRGGVHYRRYRGKWFSLESTADEIITRQIAVRLEQFFTAYRQILPPRTQSRRPLRLVVLGAMAEYQAYLARLGLKFDNPACFVEADNLVVAGSDLARFDTVRKKIKSRHNRLESELKALEERLPRRLAEMAEQLKAQGHPRSEIPKLLIRTRLAAEKEIDQKRKELKLCNRENARTIHEITRGTFARLYHEAFHAYLENYVYPHDAYHVPRWLDEGLAVVFEGAVLESDTLRIDSPNRTALKQLKADLGGPRPMSLEELLAADPQVFLRGRDANRYYVYSWGLVYYLTFERQLLGNPALDGYVQLAAENTAPAARFQKLVGRPLAEFERSWREYVSRLH